MSMHAPQFKVLTLASFHGNTPHQPDTPRVIDNASFDEVMAEMDVHFYLPLESSHCPAGGLEFRFDSLKALHPDGIVKSHPFFQHLFAAKTFLQTAGLQALNADRIREELRKWPDLPAIEIVPETARRRPSPCESSIENILNLVTLSDQDHTSAKTIGSGPDQIDDIANGILEALFADPRFCDLESAWRGLRLLLQQGKRDASAHIAISTVHTDTLVNALEALIPYVVNDLPDIILLDLPFDSTPLSIERLQAATQWAATLMVPLITWCSPAFLQISSWDKLNVLSFLPHHMETAAYAKFQKLRQSPESEWVCLTCNRFLIRYPYGTENKPRYVSFQEPTLLWIAPVWALATLILQSAGNMEWPTHFCDRHRFQIRDLALQCKDSRTPIVSEMLLDRDRLEQFARAGITVLDTEGKRDHAFFTRAVTLKGSSLAYQILFVQVIHFLLWCKDNLATPTHPTALESTLKNALQSFSQQRRPHGFEQIEMTTGTPEDGRIPLHVTLVPDAAVLSSRQKIEMRMDW